MHNKKHAVHYKENPDGWKKAAIVVAILFIVVSFCVAIGVTAIFNIIYGGDAFRKQDKGL